MEEFEEIVRELFHYVGEYGITRKQLNIDPSKNSPEDYAEFTQQVHTGYRLGQQLILKEIIPLLGEVEIIKREKQEARTAKDKKLVASHSVREEIALFKIQVLRHFADQMAWLVFKDQYHIVRRLHSGNRTRPSLLHSNLQSLLYIVDELHSRSPMNFALISDLTTFIDVGDLLLVEHKKYTIIECKEGPVQKKVFEFINEMEKDEFDPAKLDYTGVTEKFFDQLDRTLNQLQRSARLQEFIKTEKGKDPFKGVPINVVDTKIVDRHYFEELEDLIEESRKTDSACGTIEEIIYVAVFRGDKLEPSEFIFKEMVKKVNPQMIQVDYASLIYIPLKRPLLFKPFGVETIFDLLFSRLKIFLAVDIEKFIAYMNDNAVPTKWLSKKETQRYIENSKSYRPFIQNHRAISITSTSGQIILGDSFLTQLLFDNLRPSSLVERYMAMIQE